MRGRYLLVSIAFLSVSVTPVMAGISGSAHDFSVQGWSGGKICVPCHTPHNADTSVTNAPLWHHEVTTAEYTLYTSPTLDATMEQPGGVSRLCLSCHDGTVALDSYGGATGSNYITGPANLGTNLSDDHPVSFLWEHQTVGSTCDNCHFTTRPIPFFDRKVECATCHDPHNDAPERKMLRVSLTGSELCLVCHTDK